MVLIFWPQIWAPSPITRYFFELNKSVPAALAERPQPAVYLTPPTHGDLGGCVLALMCLLATAACPSLIQVHHEEEDPFHPPAATKLHHSTWTSPLSSTPSRPLNGAFSLGLRLRLPMDRLPLASLHRNRRSHRADQLGIIGGRTSEFGDDGIRRRR